MKTSLEKARGGGTFVLNLPARWEQTKSGYSHEAFRAIARARDELGIDVQRVADWDELVEFARAFARKRYAEESRVG
ncbi:MAG TPA: hypothetical protein VEQ58_14545, partial [Polyangiaceae bacterium]|nr:hypothetical protein [Polyangiaceae bacterium]